MLGDQLAAAISRANRAEVDRGAAIALADQTVALLKDTVARADQAEQGRDAERARADALRDRLDTLQVQLAAAEAVGATSDVEMAELTARLKAACLRTEEVEHAAETRHEAEATARRSLGRLARLLAAWRGK